MINAREIMDILYEAYPDAHCELNYNTPFELLVSTVLSAQTTDKKVNEVTARIFKNWNKPQDFAELSQEMLEEEIRVIGMYRTKSKHIISLSQELLTKYDGEVPADIDELMKLSGVGRKTANVVVSNAFGIPAIAVDTHVFRVSNRLGIVSASNVEETEKQLMAAIPKDEWCKAHHALIFHGRRVCAAQRPKCELCPVKDVCKSNRGVTSSDQKIESCVGEALTGKVRKRALAFISHIRANEMQLEKGKGYWEDKLYWIIEFQNECVCYILINGSGTEEKFAPWTIWSDDSDSKWFEAAPFDEQLKEIGWNNVDFCGNCGGKCSPGTRKTIFGKEFNNVCRTTFRFINPDDKTVEFVKRIAEIRKNDILRSK